jgi:hypothetical protein
VSLATRRADVFELMYGWGVLRSDVAAGHVEGDASQPGGAVGGQIQYSAAAFSDAL